MLTSAKDAQVPIDFSFLTSSSVLFDALYVPGGDKSVRALQQEPDSVEFAQEAYKHCGPSRPPAQGADSDARYVVDETPWAGLAMKVI